MAIPARPIVQNVTQMFRAFIRLEAAGGILLLACAVVALLWANSPWSESYTRLWQTYITVAVGGFEVSKPLLLWINDALMAVFFLVVGLEIKREVLVGELASLRQAALPIAAAVGGMLVPALLFAFINMGEESVRGWGIPMATDIAFSLGVLALLGRRVPLGLKVFLTAFAIVDDIGAVLVIAFFYTAQISWTALAFGAVFLVLLIVANLFGTRNPIVYTVLGLGLWLAFLKSGIHATVAGVLLALTIPARADLDEEQFLRQARGAIDEFETAHADPLMGHEEQQSALHTLEEAAERVQTPLQRIEHALLPWVSFFIMPVFALANAGVAVTADASTVMNRLTLGIVVGLIVGKQVGVTLFSWVAVRAGLATLPAGVSWGQVYGVSWLAAIGFTMSLFITDLAFGEGLFQTQAKIGVLLGSLVAGIVGYILLARSVRGSTEGDTGL